MQFSRDNGVDKIFRIFLNCAHWRYPIENMDTIQRAYFYISKLSILVILGNIFVSQIRPRQENSNSPRTVSSIVIVDGKLVMVGAFLSVQIHFFVIKRFSSLQQVMEPQLSLGIKKFQNLIPNKGENI